MPNGLDRRTATVSSLAAFVEPLDKKRFRQEKVPDKKRFQDSKVELRVHLDNLVAEHIA
tara:strand:+ start:421 stop:597 length:177 start_codon:yes stop_codon:yes gene_type:complete